MWKTRSVVLHWWKVGIFWVTRKSFQQILLAQWYEYPDLTSWKCRMLPGMLWCQSNDSCLWANMPPSLIPIFIIVSLSYQYRHDVIKDTCHSVILSCYNFVLFRCASISWIQVVSKSVRDVFQLAHLRVFQSYFNCSSRFSVPKWKTSCSQPGLLFQEIFNVKKLLVGWASSLILLLKMGRNS